MLQGILFNIQRFSVHDGPGIRTNLFFKGCPLRCEWCHNPEGLSPRPELSLLPHRCIGCGACVSVCPRQAHRLEDGMHTLDRSACTGCGLCAEKCSYGALELLGKSYTVAEAVALCKRDSLFYGETGGVTLTGGEPMLQADFALAVARGLFEEGISVCIETSGFADCTAYERLLPFIDTFLFDIKETDEASHRLHVGVGMGKIRENLRFLDENGAKIILRCPILPGINMREEHFRALAEIANGLHHVQEIHLEPYHPLGLSKGKRIGREMPYQNSTPLSREALIAWQEEMQTWTTVPVRIL